MGGFLTPQGSSASRGGAPSRRFWTSGGLQPLGLYRASRPAEGIKLHAASGLELPSLQGQNK